jgi:hypothetical protein
MGKSRGCCSLHACYEYARLPLEQGEHFGLKTLFTQGHARKVREIDD